MRLLSGSQLIWVLALLLPAALLCSLFIGPTNISPLVIFNGQQHQDLMILREIRLPRTLLSALIGAVLAISGAVLQGLFRNPLADPSLIGISAGASVGASVAIVFGMNWVSVWAIGGLSVVAFGAFVGGMAAVLLVYRLSTTSEGTSVPTMLLVGIAVSALAAAINNLMSFVVDNELLRRISFWQMGNLDLANWSRVQLCAFMSVGFLLLLRQQAKNLNAFLLGESEARHLGLDVDAIKKRLIFLAALGVGVATAMAGTIAFVGLIVPHLVRIMSGPDHRTLIPASGLLGAIILLLADLISRVLLAPSELPVGVVTAFLGVPFFIYLLRQQKGRIM
jgi:iron complex transport system permease protein